MRLIPVYCVLCTVYPDKVEMDRRQPILKMMVFPISLSRWWPMLAFHILSLSPSLSLYIWFAFKFVIGKSALASWKWFGRLKTMHIFNYLTDLSTFVWIYKARISRLKSNEECAMQLSIRVNRMKIVQFKDSHM